MGQERVWLPKDRPEPDNPEWGATCCRQLSCSSVSGVIVQLTTDLTRLHILGNPDDCCGTVFNVFIRRRPTRNRDSHRCVALPNSSSAPAGTISLYLGNDPPGLLWTAERNQYLVENDVIEHGRACRTETIGK